MKKIILFTIHFSLLTLLVSCEKVSPIGVLVSNTAVEDRVKMSYMYYKDHKLDVKCIQLLIRKNTPSWWVPTVT